VKAELGEGEPGLSLAMINPDLSNQRITNHESRINELTNERINEWFFSNISGF
jgi:hypothetical protein